MGDVVYPVGDGSVARASANDGDIHIGVVRELKVLGRCIITTYGIVSVPTTTLIVPGKQYYLSTIPGKITVDPPTSQGTWVHRVGVAISPTELLIQPDTTPLFNKGVCIGISPVCWNPADGRLEVG